MLFRSYDAIVLACAGLRRLGLAARIRAVLPPEQSLPAVGQGALGIETLADRPEVIAALAPLHHAPTAACVLAERAVSRGLGGSCQTPLAAYAQLDGTHLRLRAMVASPDGAETLTGEAQGTADDAEALGQRMADDLLGRGAGRLLAAAAAA